jgi:hypothetical protein
MGRSIRVGLLSIAALSLGVSVRAQCGNSIGAKGGVNLGKSSFSGGSTGVTSDDSRRTGLAAGVVINGECFEHFAVQLEGLYVRRETKFLVPATDVGPAITALYKVDWIDFPLSAMGLFNSSGEKFRPFIFAGVDFAARFRAKSENTSDGVTREFDAKSQVKKSMFSVFGGAGAKFRTGEKFWLTLDGRYVYGLTNISPDSHQKWKNRDLQFLGGFLWVI